MSKASDSWKAWQENVADIQRSYPFGPVQEFRNEIGNRHRIGGPAYISPSRCTYYVDGRRHGVDVDIWGSKCFYYENILIPPRFFLYPESLTLKEIMAHPNAEVRYVGMRIFGYERLLKQEKVKQVHEDADRGEILFEVSGVFDRPFRVVQVVNSTAEPDGTYKKYYLTVPPTVNTCKEAVAWTFGVEDAREYNPAVES